MLQYGFELCFDPCAAIWVVCRDVPGVLGVFKGFHLSLYLIRSIKHSLLIFASSLFCVI